MKRICPNLLLFAIIWITHSCAFGQMTPGLFQEGFQSHSFVENQGQFDHRLPTDPLKYGVEREGQQIFLAANKVYFYLYQIDKHAMTSEEKKLRALRKKEGFSRPEDFEIFEKEGKRLSITSDMLTAEWVGANPDAELIPREKDPFTHSYEVEEKGEVQTLSGISSYQIITYKNLYPHIDVEYTLHPESGVKYSLILHPGADISQVRLRYSKKPTLQSDGSVSTPTLFGPVIDHSPYTFYQERRGEIASAYMVDDHDILFSIAPYNLAETVIFDPWTDLPNDPGSNWNCAWECETDALGNTYTIFGAMPLQLRKYNAAGAIQWTYNTTYDSTSWMGTFVTDDAGNSYVTRGSVAAMRKVNTAGALQWSVGNISGMLLGEFWNIAFNCDQTKLIVGGTGGVFIPEPYIFEVNPASGALLGSVLIHGGSSLFSPQEVRAVTATENAKYYWMTHDSIGFLSQSFSSCPTPQPELIADNTYSLGYKCENWRYNNTGIEAIAYYNGFVYVNRGNRIDKRNVTTAAIVASATIPGGTFTSGFGGAQVENSGIIIDNTGRIFVGSKGSVSEFDVNLNLIGTTAVTAGFNVYDVDLTSSGQLIACGSSGNSGSGSRTGYVESLGVLGSGPFAMPCCDASICNAGPFCDTEGPVTLTAGVGGGVWSSLSLGFNPVTAQFDPATAGTGSHTIYYTMPCGTDSVTLYVATCATLNMCREAGGDLTVTGGTAPFTWEEGTMVSSCPFGPGSGCNFITHTVSSLNWSSFGTGATITPPPGADTVRVSEASLTTTSWDISALPTCGPLPLTLVSFEGEAIGEGTNFLNWTTATELNVDQFSLRSSGNGIDWKEISMTDATGSTSTGETYSFTDRQPHFPVTLYRLGEVDMNGKYRLLSTLKIQAKDTEQLVYNLHPNPAKNHLYFTYHGDNAQKSPLLVKVINHLGQVVQEGRYDGLAPNAPLSLDISRHAAGVYHVYFQQASRSAYAKTVILRGK